MSKLSIPLLVVVILLGSVSLYGNNIFNQADSLHQALNVAKSKSKLLLAYAAVSSAPCCIAMENATFQDSEIRQLIATSFYPIKINLSNAIGQSWISRFQIANRPTLLFFDEQGTLIKQVENALSSKELISIIKEVLFFNKNDFWPIETGQQVLLTAYVPDHIDTQSTIISENREELMEVIPSSTLISNTDDKTIRILLDQLPTSDPSVKTKVESIKKQFPHCPLMIKLVRDKQEAYYQIWVGEFSQSADAQLLKDALLLHGFQKAVVIPPISSEP